MSKCECNFNGSDFKMCKMHYDMYLANSFIKPAELKPSFYDETFFSTTGRMIHNTIDEKITVDWQIKTLDHLIRVRLLDEILPDLGNIPTVLQKKSRWQLLYHRIISFLQKWDEMRYDDE